MDDARWRADAERYEFVGEEVTDKEITERYVGKYLPQRLRKQGLAAPVLYEPKRAFGD